MNIWLINPPLGDLGIQRQGRVGILPVVRSLFYNSPPLGLAYVAAVLEREGHTVTITDAPVEGLSASALAECAHNRPPELIGLTATTAYFHMAADTARRIRGSAPGVPICIGGPHFTANPDLLVEHRCFDFGVRGEGERTIVEVMKRLESGLDVADVPGVVTGRNGALRFGPPRPLIADLDSLPLPARHLLPIHLYVPLPNDQHRLPKTSMISSRGCPFQCIFCDKQTFGNRYRSMRPARIVKEMHALESSFGIRDIAFVDSIFTPNRKRIEGILDAMEADPPRTSWTCSCRANVLTEELLGRMKAAGCWRIRIAIESGNDAIRRRIQKGISREDFARTARTANRLGMQVKCFFMIGHIGETRETIEDSIRFALALPVKDITVQINTPLRGTPQYEDCAEHGTLSTHDSSRSTFFQPVFVPKGLTARELMDAHKRFYRRFYLRPRVIWHHAKTIRHLSDMTKYLRALPLVANQFFGGR